jgi:hypothetical protein
MRKILNRKSTEDGKEKFQKSPFSVLVKADYANHV